MQAQQQKTPRSWIIEKLAHFNILFDAFILEAAKPLAIIGFVLGTIDIYTRGGIATNPWFSTGWSIAQALVIDGLFFAVWWRFFGAKWKRKWGRVLANLGLLFIGLFLSFVAILTNMVIGFQQLWGVADSQAALAQLGVNPVLFTVARSVLMVLVTVLVAFTYYKSGDIQVERRHSPKEQSAQSPVTTVPTVPNSVPSVPNSVRRGRTVVRPIVPLIAQRTQRDTVKQAMLNRVNSGVPINLREIAQDTQVSYSTVRKYAPGLKQEIGI